MTVAPCQENQTRHPTAPLDSDNGERAEDCEADFLNRAFFLNMHMGC